MVTNTMVFMTMFQGITAKLRVVHVGGTLQKVEKVIKAKTSEWLETK